MSIYAKSWEISALPISTDRLIYYVKKTDSTAIITKDEYNALTEERKAEYEGRPSSWDGRSLTEANLSNFVKCLLDPETAKGFVVSETFNTFTNKYTQINFVLGGYYFELTDTTLLNNTYLSVQLNYNTSPSATDPYKYLLGDSGVEYQGLVFYTDTTQPGDLILIKDGVIPTSSYFKFNTRSIENICGGTV